MRITVLGSGTAIPEADRFPAGVLVEAGDEVVLVDAGPGVLRRLAATGVGLERLTTVLLTHDHPDHCADLVALLFALRNPAYAGRPPLRLLGGPGLFRLLRGLRAAWPRWLEPRDYTLEEREIGPGAIAMRGVDATAVAVDHSPSSLAYRFREHGSGACAAVTGDADHVDGPIEAGRGADVLVCEAAFPATHAADRHLSARDAGRVATRAGARLLCLTHLYPLEWAGRDPAAEAREAFSGEIVVAEDLLAIDIGEGGEIVVRPPPPRS